MNQSDRTGHTPQSAGLSLQEKEAFLVQRALPAMAQHTFGFICSVIGVFDQTTGRHYGSGLRCMLNGRRAILTALHVVEEARQAPRGIAISTGYGQRPYVVHGTINLDPFADLSVYFVPDDFPVSAANFWPTARIDRAQNQLATDYLFVHGFPGKSSYPSQLLLGVVSKSLPYGAMQRLENLPSTLQDFQFAVEYDPAGMVAETGQSEELIDPHGLSGSPVWRIGISGRSSHTWEPSECLLVGTVTRWSPDQKVLIATSTAKLPPDW